jgi:hypothetical protein
MSQFAKSVYCTLSSLLIAACGAESSSPSEEAPSGSALTRSYGALTEGAQHDVTRVIADVDGAVAADPSNGHLVFYSAIMRFWQLGEEIDLPKNPLDVLAIARTMVDRFREAQALLPNDDRAPAFGGLGKTIIGNILGDSALRSEGMADIDEGIRIFPSYSHFLRALASAQAPAASDDFAAVLPHMQATLDTCGMKKDAAGNYEYLEGPLPASLRPCNDDGVVPHVWEGFLINYGDLLLKGGKGAHEARLAYEGAKLAPRFDKWPFAAALQDRIDHADERAALYADGDASNDPKLWMQDGHVCTGCHQDTP